MSDPNKFDEAYRDSTPKKVQVMSEETLDAFYHYFVDLLPYANQHPNMRLMAEHRIEILAREIERRERVKAEAERDQTSKERHDQTRGIAQRAIRISTTGVVISGIGVALALAFGVLSYRANRQPPKPMSVSSDIQPSTSPLPQTSPLQATAAPTATTTTESPTPKPSQSPQLSSTPEP